jgi:hypothetical protein
MPCLFYPRKAKYLYLKKHTLPLKNPEKHWKKTPKTKTPHIYLLLLPRRGSILILSVPVFPRVMWRRIRDFRIQYLEQWIDDVLWRMIRIPA